MAATLLDPVIGTLNANGAGGIDPKRLADMLHMTASGLAELAGVHRTTLARNADSPEVQGRLGPIATILSRASDMGGGQGRAVTWFRHQPIAAFGHKCAADLVAAGEARQVLDWLDALEDGAYA